MSSIPPSQAFIFIYVQENTLSSQLILPHNHTVKSISYIHWKSKEICVRRECLPA